MDPSILTSIDVIDAYISVIIGVGHHDCLRFCGDIKFVNILAFLKVVFSTNVFTKMLKLIYSTLF